MNFTLEEDNLLGTLVVLLDVVIVVIVVIVVTVWRRNHKKKGSFIVIPPPRAGWGNARGGQIHGGTVPGWGEYYTRPCSSPPS